MNRKWVIVSLVCTTGIAITLGYQVYDIANQIDYEVLSYNIQLLDSEGVTFRVMFGIVNPTRYNLSVWQQKYDVYLSGSKVSQITSINSYKLLANDMSPVPLDITLKWADIEKKIAPLLSDTETGEIGKLPVFIKGHFAAKLGIFRFSWIPFRMTLPLSDFLP